MFTVYLAARYSRRVELVNYAADVRLLGYDVTSRWLNGSHQISDAGLSDEGSSEERRRFAEEDWSDLMRADCCISFTEQPRTPGATRGGRHVEFGAAMAAGKRCIVVGPRENVFHCLPTVIWFATWPECIEWLESQ